MGDDHQEAAHLEKKAKKKKKEAAIAESPAEASEEKAKKRKSSEIEPAAGGTETSKGKNKKQRLLRLAAKELTPAKEEGATTLPPRAEEDERRQAQREIQQLVVRLRAEGKSKQEIEAAKRDLKTGLGKTLRNPDGQRAKKIEAWKQKMATEDGQKKLEEKQQKGLEHKHDIVVIPVIWRGRHDQQEIQKAAEDVKAFLAQQGLDVWVDSRRQYTPGQKFAHWEFRGVMLRIEIGPEDYTAGMLKLCRAKEAGDYQSVEKKRLRLPPAGSRRLLLALKDWGFSQIEIERRDGDSASEEEAEPVGAKSTARGAGKTASAPDPDEDVAGNWKPRVVSDQGSKKKKQKHRRTE